METNPSSKKRKNFESILVDTQAWNNLTRNLSIKMIKS